MTLWSLDTYVTKTEFGQSTAFVGGDRLGLAWSFTSVPRTGLELLLIAIDPSPLDHDIALRLGHLQGIVNRPDGLLLERMRPAVLTLNVIEGGIRESGRLPATEAGIDDDGYLSSIGKSGSVAVTTGTGNPIIWTNLPQDEVASRARFWRHN